MEVIIKSINMSLDKLLSNEVGQSSRVLDLLADHMSFASN